MDGTIRIIETSYPFGGRLAHVYVLCLPPAAMSRLGEVLEQMTRVAPEGVEQFMADEAGLLIYTRDGFDTGQTCLATLSVINALLQAELKLDPRASYFYVGDYGNWDGATTYTDLLRNPNFVLPYMRAVVPGT